MAILLKNGAVFLHIPKTGGTWVTRALEKLDLIDQEFGHMHANLLRVLHNRAFPVGKSSYGELNRPLTREIDISTFKFCFVRHPLAWFESWWSYMTDCQWPTWGDNQDKNRWHPVQCFNQLKHLDFNSFVAEAIRVQPGFVTELFSGYTANGMHFIGKQETLVDDLIQVFRLMGLTVDQELLRDLPIVNESQQSKAQIEWDPQLLETVTRLEWAGLVRYGYTTC